MKLSPVLLGFLVSMPMLSGSLLRIPFSAWVDTTGGRKPFLTLLGLSVLGMAGITGLLFSLYPERLGPAHYPLVLFLGFLSGCGIATFSVGISQVAYWFPQSRQGWALGVYAGLGNLAPGLFALLLPLALAAWGLPFSYLAWLIFLLVGTGLYWLTGRNAWYFQLVERGFSREEATRVARGLGQELFPAGGLALSLKRSAAIWRTWALVILYFATFGGFIGLTAWLPTYWQSFFGFGSVAAGALTALYSILTSLARAASGGLSDRMGGESTSLLALLVMIVGAFLMTISHTPGLSVAGEIFLALGMGVNNAAVFKLVPFYVPEAVGGAAGWVGGLGAFGGFAIPPIMGAFVRSLGTAGYATGFVTFAVLAFLSVVLVAVLKAAARRRGQPARL